MSSHYDNASPVQQIECWREGPWVLVALDGETVYRRFTRDPAFTNAWVIFYSNQSPSVPQSRVAYQRVELRGSWRFARRDGFYNNRIGVPILPARGVVWASGQPVLQRNRPADTRDARMASF